MYTLYTSRQDQRAPALPGRSLFLPVPPLTQPQAYDLPLTAIPDLKKTLQVEIPASVHSHNGTMYAHMVLWRAGRPLDLTDPSREDIYGKSFPLNVYKPKRKVKEYVNLLEAKKGDIERMHQQHEEVKNAPIEIVSYWRPNLTLALVQVFQPYLPQQVVPMAQKHIQT
jgi:hypothetical protein